jgi:hypothetical protein
MQSLEPPLAPPPPPAPRPKASGCVIALIVVGALAVFGCIAFAVGIAVYFRTDDGKKVAGVIGAGIRVSTEAQNAPGAREIEKVGCSQGLVFDMDKMEAFTRAIVGDGSAEAPKSDVGTMVLCQVNMVGSPPTCDDVKHAYLDAVPSQSGPFLVQVTRMTETKPRCMSAYSAKGEPLKDMKGWR